MKGKFLFRTITMALLAFLLTVGVLPSPAAAGVNDMTITGIVQDDLGKPLRDVLVTPYFYNTATDTLELWSPWATFRTDKDGHYTIPPMDVQNAMQQLDQVKVKFNSWTGQEAWAQHFLAYGEVSISCTIVTHGAVSLRVVDENGDPVPAGVPFWIVYDLPNWASEPDWAWHCPADGVNPEHFTDANGIINLWLTAGSSKFAVPAGKQELGSLQQTGALRYDVAGGQNDVVGMDAYVGQTKENTFRIKPLGKIVVQAVDAETSQPISSPQWLYESIRYVEYGDNSLTLYGSGSITVTASDPDDPASDHLGHDGASKTVSIVPWSDVPVTLSLTPHQPGTVTGKVLDSNGNTVSGATVEMLWEEQGEVTEIYGIKQVVTGVDGSYRFTDVVPDSSDGYSVRASMEGYAPASAEEISVTSGMTVNISDLVLKTTRSSVIIAPTSFRAGDTATVTTAAYNADGTELPDGTTVMLTTTLGSLSPAPDFSYSDSSVSASVYRGEVSARLSSDEAGAGTVTLSVDGVEAASAAFTVTSDTVAAPTISPNGGTFTGSTTVTITGSGGTIYYTTDGSRPTTSSALYTAPFTLSQSATVNAAVYNSSNEWSGVASAIFTKTGGTLTISQTNGAALALKEDILNNAVVRVALTDDTFKAGLTKDSFKLNHAAQGLTVKSVQKVEGSEAYDLTLVFDNTDFDTDITNFSITALAAAVTGGVDVTCAETTITAVVEAPVPPATPPTPTISPNGGGTYTGSTTVTITGSGGTIYYTTDGSTPTTSSALYTAPFTLSQSTTVKAAVYNSSTGWSGVASSTFTKTTSSSSGHSAGSQPQPAANLLASSTLRSGEVATVQANDGTLISIPAGALAGGSTTFTISLGVEGNDPSSPNIVSFDSKNTARTFGPSGTVFNSPVTITIPFGDANVDPNDLPHLAIFLWQDGRWQKVGGVVDPVHRTISVPVSHFSTYRVMADRTPVAERIGGIDRYQTAVQIAQNYFASGADSVVLTRGDISTDALTAVPLARHYNAPLLLTPQDKLPNEVLNEIKALGAKTVYIVGGEKAVSNQIAAEITEQGIIVQRVAGTDRYSTAYEVAKLMGRQGVAVVVNGNNDAYPDALSVSSWAAYNGVPILYADGTDQLPDVTTKALTELKVTRTILVGGTAVLPKSLEALVPNPERYGGIDRYATNAQVLSKLQPNPVGVFVATGMDFADALAGAAVAGQSGAWVVLVENDLSLEQQQLLQTAKSKVLNFHVFGGTAVVPDHTLSKVRSLLGR